MWGLWAPGKGKKRGEERSGEKEGSGAPKSSSPWARGGPHAWRAATGWARVRVRTCGGRGGAGAVGLRPGSWVAGCSRGSGGWVSPGAKKRPSSSSEEVPDTPTLRNLQLPGFRLASSAHVLYFEFLCRISGKAEVVTRYYV